MMSGDSPNSHAASADQQLLDLKEQNRGGKAQHAGETVTASVLVEPVQRDGGGSQRNPNAQTEDEAIQTAETPLTTRKEQAANGGTVDGTDSVPMPNSKTRATPGDGKQASRTEDEDEEGCAVRCLYYTLQCCECAVM